MVHKDKDPSLRSLLLQEALKARGLYSGELDNWWGQKSDAAYAQFLRGFDATGRKIVMASTFADPGDISAFRKCKATGKSDHTCFQVGDNGIGFYGQDTTPDNIAYCALPPEEIKAKWGSVEAGNSRLVTVYYKDRRVDCILADTMPPEDYIGALNGAGIDLNPGAVKVLGLPPGGMVDVEWEWIA